MREWLGPKVAIVLCALLFAAGCTDGSGGTVDVESAGADTGATASTAAGNAGSAAQGNNGSSDGDDGDSESESDSGGESDGGESDGNDDSDDDGSGDEGQETTTTTEAPTTGPSACPGSVTPIRFASGAVSAEVVDEVDQGDQKYYTLEVGEGQIMSVTLGTDDDVVFDVFAPGGQVVDGDVTRYESASTTAGTYGFCVTSFDPTGRYLLMTSVINDTSPTKVDALWCGSSVNDRGAIRFASGEFSTIVPGSVIRGERDLYTIDVGADQWFYAVLTSLEDNAVYTLRDPEGGIIVESSDFRFPTPFAGTYEICIGGTRGNANYDLYIEVS